MASDNDKETTYLDEAADELSHASPVASTSTSESKDTVGHIDENVQPDKQSESSKDSDEFCSPPFSRAPFQSDIERTLESLNEELSLLNEASGGLQTPIHKSNKQKRLELAKKYSPKKIMSLYVSPSKKFSSQIGRGIKRSPSKPLPGLRKPKRKRFTTGKDTGNDVKKVKSEEGNNEESAETREDLKWETGNETGVEGDQESSAEDSDEDQWHIIEDSDTEIDKALEDRAQKNNLTARNVKNILHQVITNEQVVAMVRNTLLKEQGKEADIDEAVYEPRMTRSKVKQTIEENGEILHPWPLTPLKKPQKKTFLDLELTDSESESDTDYDPTKQGPCSLSDEDSESMTSSHFSDFGSPSTPATPRSTLTSASDLERTPSVIDNTDEIKSPMGPPSTPFGHRQGALGKKFKDAMAENDRRQEEEENIARRTRSKVSLEDTSILDLEANFVPPDFTPEMFDTSIDMEDTFYWGFLSSLIQPTENENTNDNDDEENDPEFNILDEIDKLNEEKKVEDHEKEEVRTDRAVQVSKKEMNQLMDELFQFYEETADWDEEDGKSLKSNLSKAKSQLQKKWTEQGNDAPSGDNVPDTMTSSQREQLADQMRKHVQLLAQMYIMASANLEDYGNVASSSRSLLGELWTFKQSNSVCFTSSTAYNACNLEEAYHLVNQERSWETHNKSTKRNKVQTNRRSIVSRLMKNYDQLTVEQKDKIMAVIEDPKSYHGFDPHLAKTLPDLTAQQQNLMWTSSIFIYPQLLPSFGFQISTNVKSQNQRVTFTEAEDNLIALGLEQFGKYPFFRELIQKFLLPSKTSDQIKIRIKNLGCSKAQDNAVKYFRMNKRLPPFPFFAGTFNSNEVCPPKEQNIQALPHWCKELMIEQILGEKEEMKDFQGGAIQRSRSVPLVSSERVQLVEEHSNSAPATPMTSKLTRKPKPQLAVRKLTPVLPVGSLSSPVIYSPIHTPEMLVRAQSSTCVLSGSTECASEELSSPATLGTSSQKEISPRSDTRKTSSRTSLKFDEEAIGIVPTAVTNTEQNSDCLLKNMEDFISNDDCDDLAYSSKECEEESQEHSEENEKQWLLPASVSDAVQISSHQSNNSMKYLSPELITVTTGTLGIDTPRVQQELTSVQTSDIAIHTTNSPIKNVISLTQSGSTLILNISNSANDKTSAKSKAQGASVSEIEMEPSSEMLTNNESCRNNNQNAVTTQSVELNNSEKNVTSSTTQTLEGVSITQAGASNIKVKLSDSAQISQESLPTPVKSHTIGSISSLSDTNQELSEKTSAKTALEIVASYAPYMINTSREIPLSQQNQETTPTKKNVTRYRALAPKPMTSTLCPVQPIFTKSPRKSPRRKQLQRKAQAICPKGLVIKPVVSPSKKAADVIVHKALGRGMRRILPKPPHMPSNQLTIHTRSSSRRQLINTLKSETDEDYTETASEYDTVEGEYLSDEVMEDIDKTSMRKKVTRQKCLSESGRSVESDDLQSENEDINLYDSQNEDEFVADLMTASTTIEFSQKKPSNKDKRSKTKRRKEAAIAILAPNLVETDPLGDDRDTAFAQAYLAKARDMLKAESGLYEKFLRVLYEFSKGEQSPIKLYNDLKLVLQNYPDLMHDFAGFLLPHQAVECGCFMATQEFIRARAFLRKLEIYFERNPGNYQKVMRILSRWSKEDLRDPKELKESLEPLFKSQLHIMEEFSLFFPEDKPPDSMLRDFEDVVLGDSEDDEASVDGFEELILPEEEEPNGTKKCQCSCHHNPRLINFHKRIKHCYSCCLKVIDGELYYKVNKQVLRRVRVTKHKPIKAKGSHDNPESEAVVKETLAWTDDDEEMAEKENVRLIPQTKPKHMGIKLKISSKKKGKQKRFYTLKEMTESPIKTEHNSTQGAESASSAQLSEVTPPFLPDVIPTGDVRRTDNEQQLNSLNPNNTMVESKDNEKRLSTRSECAAVTEVSSHANKHVNDHDSDRISHSSSLLNTDESSCADILAKALKEAMISQNDVTLDGNFDVPGKDNSDTESVDIQLTSNGMCTSEASERSQNSSHSDIIQTCFSDKSSGEPTSVVISNKVPLETENEKLASKRSYSDNSATNSSNEKRRITPVPVLDDKICTSPAFRVPPNEESFFGIKSPSSVGPCITYSNSPLLNSESSSDNRFSSQRGMASQKLFTSPIKSAVCTSAAIKDTTTSVKNPSRDTGSKNVTSPCPSSRSAASPCPTSRDVASPCLSSKNIVSPCPSSNQSWGSESNKTIISSVIGFGNDGDSKDSGQCNEKRMDLTFSLDKSSEDSKSIDTVWSKDNDRVILETVKQLGPASSTFEVISKTLSGRTANQVSKRFHHLLEMLAEEETPSEEETSEMSSS